MKPGSSRFTSKKDQKKRKQREEKRRDAEEARASSVHSVAIRPSRSPAAVPVSVTIRTPQPAVSPPRSAQPPRRSLASEPNSDLPIGWYVVRTIERSDPDFIKALRAWPPRFPNDLPRTAADGSDSSAAGSPISGRSLARDVSSSAANGVASGASITLRAGAPVWPSRSPTTPAARLAQNPPAAVPEVPESLCSSDGVARPAELSASEVMPSPSTRRSSAEIIPAAARMPLSQK